MFFEPIYEKYFEESEDLEQQIQNSIDKIADLPEMAHRCKKVYGYVPASIEEVFKDDPIGDESPYLWDAKDLANRIADEYLTDCYMHCDIDEPPKNQAFDQAVDGLAEAIALWQKLNREAIQGNSNNFLAKHNLMLFSQIRRFEKIAKQEHFCYEPDYSSRVAIEYSARWIKEMFGGSK